MHRTQADHNVANLFSDVLPGTLIVKDDLNAFQEELARTVEDSGQTLAASGAADQAAGWHQLTEAIRRLPLVQTEDVTVTLVTGVATSLAPAAGENFIRIERSGGVAAPGADVVLPNNVAYNGRIITIRNSANLILNIKDRRGYLSLMAHLCVQRFYCFTDDAGAHYDWAPMDGEYSGVFSATYDFSNVVASIAAQDFIWKKKGSLVTLFMPGFSDAATGTVNAGNLVSVNLPTWLRATNYHMAPLVFSPSAPPDYVGRILIGTTQLIIDGIVDTNTGIPPQVIQYLSSNELTGP